MAKTIPKAKLYIGGAFVDSETTMWMDVLNPATQEIQTRVPLSTKEEMQRAVDAAKAAYPVWSRMSVTKRIKCMLAWYNLIQDNLEEIARAITEEEGKTITAARTDVRWTLDLLQHAFSAGSMIQGETVGDVAKHLDSYTIREPLGVCAGISSFNFPAAMPMLEMAVAIVCGNTFVLKPSEFVPTAAVILARLFGEAGFPPGVLNVFHGRHDAVNFICDNPDIKTVSFIGSTPAGKYIYNRATLAGKNVQANMGAHCHAVVMPDADKELAIQSVLHAAYAESGQKCMAIKICVLIGEAKQWIPDFVKAVEHFKTGNPMDESTFFGPVVTRESKDRIFELINKSIEQGATPLVDGRTIRIPGFEKGNFVGPTILGNVREDMECYKTEIFGPCVGFMCMDTLDEAIKLVNKNAFGNGVAIFTQDGSTGRYFQHEVNIMQVGINAAVPIAIPTMAFTGSKDSWRGMLHMQGSEAYEFFTQRKTVFARWNYPPGGSSSEGQKGKRQRTG
eukprot:tig00001206_g7488.t1